jgi:hypothetical protein
MKKAFIYTLSILLSLFLFFGSESVSAKGLGWFGGFNNIDSDTFANRMQTVFQNQANILGISVEDVKNCWAQGKNINQCALDHGITQEQLQQKIKDYHLAQLKSRIQVLVDKGIITQNQADQRFQFIKEKIGSLGFNELRKGLCWFKKCF